MIVILQLDISNLRTSLFEHILAFTKQCMSLISISNFCSNRDWCSSRYRLDQYNSGCTPQLKSRLDPSPPKDPQVPNHRSRRKKKRTHPEARHGRHGGRRYQRLPRSHGRRHRHRHRLRVRYCDLVRHVRSCVE